MAAGIVLAGGGLAATVTAPGFVRKCHRSFRCRLHSGPAHCRSTNTRIHDSRASLSSTTIAAAGRPMRTITRRLRRLEERLRPARRAIARNDWDATNRLRGDLAAAGFAASPMESLARGLGPGKRESLALSFAPWGTAGAGLPAE